MKKIKKQLKSVLSAETSNISISLNPLASFDKPKAHYSLLGESPFLG